MGILVGIISLMLGLFIFMSGLGSFFIGFPLAKSASAKRSKKVYAGNIVFTLIVDIIVIVLMVTILSEFFAWILIGYFIIPFIVYFFAASGMEQDAKQMIAHEIEQDMLKAAIFDEILNYIDEEDSDLP